jgi:hypothetical protein
VRLINKSYEEKILNHIIVGGNKMANYVVIDYKTDRAKKLSDALGGAIVAENADAAMKQEDIGSVTLLIAKSGVKLEEKLQPLLEHFGYHAFVYDIAAKPEQIAEDYKQWMYNFDHRRDSKVPKLPESLLMVLQVYGKKPVKANPTNPDLMV